MTKEIAENQDGTSVDNTSASLSTAMSEVREHEYLEWSLITFADSADLYKGGEKLPRADYPEGFDRYLPIIHTGNELFKVATLPGMTGDFRQCVKVYLGPAWDSGIATDLQNRSFIGDSKAIISDRDTASSIDGWKLTQVSIEKQDDDSRVGNLYFSKNDNSEKLVARWGWRG